MHNAQGLIQVPAERLETWLGCGAMRKDGKHPPEAALNQWCLWILWVKGRLCPANLGITCFSVTLGIFIGCDFFLWDTKHHGRDVLEGLSSRQGSGIVSLQCSPASKGEIQVTFPSLGKFHSDICTFTLTLWGQDEVTGKFDPSKRKKKKKRRATQQQAFSFNWESSKKIFWKKTLFLAYVYCKPGIW